ncbi:unnamed protein product [Triticum turgidum subsp. durum]|uniref:Transposase (putative) gypsy type domain-containing protein n=3 Tax=Triticum TaxID=4564 RepID=A0A9R0Z687_TRITD|nr:unnamed protein product [Triticum turgidum subsp. durum]
MPSPPSSAVIILSDSDDDDDAAALLLIAAERFTSSLTTEAEVQALCEKHGVPGKLAALPAGDRRACSPPPARAVCVYAHAHALEAGVRFPLPAFFCQTLSHFDLAPGQLTPDGWRVLVGFLALCHDASVPPSVAVFRHFFSLRSRKGWYCFRCKEGAGALVTGLGSSESDGESKRGFFFLTAPEEWPCPVRWGAPTAKVSAAGPELSSQDKKSVADLVYKHGAAVDIRTYLREADLAAAFSSNLAGASPPPPPPSPRTTGDKGMNPPEEKAAETEKVNTEPDGDTPPLSGKKRKQGETAIVEDELCRSALTTPPPASPPGLSGGFFDPKPQHSPVPDAHDGDSADWKVSQKVLECIVTPSRDDKFAASKPSDVVASTYVAMLQAANYVSFSSGYALDLDEKLVARERDKVALLEQLDKEKAARQATEAELEKAKAELAAVKRATLQSAKATAVHQFLGSEEYKRRLDEHAAAGYESGGEEMKGVVLRHYPRLDAAKLVLPLD